MLNLVKYLKCGRPEGKLMAKQDQREANKMTYKYYNNLRWLFTDTHFLQTHAISSL